MKKSLFIIFFISVFSNILFTPVIKAVTLKELIDGTNLLVTDKLFSDFNLEIENLTKEEIDQIANNIDVDGINDPLNPGISLNSVDI